MLSAPLFVVFCSLVRSLSARAPFNDPWIVLASFWYPFVGLGLHFGTLLVALGSILVHCCCISMLPSFLCMDFAPQPNLANLVFEQHFGVLCLKTKFLCFHKHIVFRCVSFFFCQHCLSWFLMRFGIDVGSLLGAFSKNIPFFFGWTSKLISDNI